MNASPVPAANRNLTLVGRLMLIEVVTFAIASILHFGVAESFIRAAIPEAIIAVVLAVGAVSVMRRLGGSWWIAMGTTLFALAGVIIGLSVILGSGVSRPIDHATIFVALVVTVILVLRSR